MLLTHAKDQHVPKTLYWAGKGNFFLFQVRSADDRNHVYWMNGAKDLLEDFQTLNEETYGDHYMEISWDEAKGAFEQWKRQQHRQRLAHFAALLDQHGYFVAANRLDHKLAAEEEEPQPKYQLPKKRNTPPAKMVYPFMELLHRSGRDDRFGTIDLGDYLFSVQAGPANMSAPKEFSLDPTVYREWELALFNKRTQNVMRYEELKQILPANLAEYFKQHDVIAANVPSQAVQSILFNIPHR